MPTIRTSFEFDYTKHNQGRQNYDKNKKYY